MKKKRLFEKHPKRLFTFGCSFTNYMWPTWADILRYDLDCPHYNFAKSGAGNQFISTMVTLADQHYQFTKDDLVIINWTNIAREDRYTGGWELPGNIYSQELHHKKWVKRWGHQDHYALRDFSYIALVSDYLKTRTNYHMSSMLNLKDVHQYKRKRTSVTQFDKLLKKELLPSFYKILWNGSLKTKLRNNMTMFRHEFDCHPLPSEHLTYLQKTYDHEFSANTIKKVYEVDSSLIEFVKSFETQPNIEEVRNQIETKYKNTLGVSIDIDAPKDMFY
jgi:hypothetical protein